MTSTGAMLPSRVHMSEGNIPSDFIRDVVADDLRTGKHSKIVTRFPPEPNGYLHIGHAKSICLNFGIVHEFNGICNVRMDDTNPTKEETEYVDSIMADVHWLIDGWADKNLGGAPLYTSDYFDRLYQFALELIAKGKAYVDDMTAEETDEFRRLGKESRFRNRSIEENRDLFERMKRASSLTARARCEQRSTSTRQISGCATRCFIAFGTPLITIPGINGPFIRCTTGPIP